LNAGNGRATRDSLGLEPGSSSRRGIGSQSGGRPPDVRRCRLPKPPAPRRHQLPHMPRPERPSVCHGRTARTKGRSSATVEGSARRHPRDARIGGRLTGPPGEDSWRRSLAPSPRSRAPSNTADALIFSLPAGNGSQSETLINMSRREKGIRHSQASFRLRSCFPPLKTLHIRCSFFRFHHGFNIGVLVLSPFHNFCRGIKLKS
jgi:hypothetical protein